MRIRRFMLQTMFSSIPKSPNKLILHDMPKGLGVELNPLKSCLDTLRLSIVRLTIGWKRKWKRLYSVEVLG